MSNEHNNAPVPEWDNKAYMTAIAGLRVKYGISHAMADLYYESWVELVRHSQKLEEQIARMNEHNNAPAVPQGFEPAGYLLHWPSFGGSRKVIWNESRVSGDAIGCPVTQVFKQSAATPSPAPAQEQCNACLGTGRMVRDPDIGTDQECFVCDGAGYEPEQEVGLTEAERVRCLIASGCIGTVKMTYDSGPYEITRTSINASRLIDAIIAALREKGAV